MSMRTWLAVAGAVTLVVGLVGPAIAAPPSGGGPPGSSGGDGNSGNNGGTGSPGAGGGDGGHDGNNSGGGGTGGEGGSGGPSGGPSGEGGAPSAGGGDAGTGGGDAGDGGSGAPVVYTGAGSRDIEGDFKTCAGPYDYLTAVRGTSFSYEATHARDAQLLRQCLAKKGYTFPQHVDVESVYLNVEDSTNFEAR